MKIIIASFLIATAACAQEPATLTGPIQVWQGTRYLGFANGELFLPASDIALLEHGAGGQMVPGGTYSLRLTNSTYTLPPRPPKLAATAPPYITDCPNLLFADYFNQGNTQLTSELSNWGPITGSVRWQTGGKADGSNWSLHGFQVAFNPANNAPNVGPNNYYDASPGWLLLNDKFWLQYAASWQWVNGKDEWYTPALCSASYANGLGGNYGNVSGFTVKAPCFIQITEWFQQLMPWDAHWIAGFWPSNSAYNIPTMSGPNGESYEIDFPEVFSVNYALPHCAVTARVSGKTTFSVFSNFSNTQFPDLSLGWHTWGLWIDTNAITFYLDGVAIFSSSNPVPANLPLYFVIAAAMGGPGWEGPGGAVPACPSSIYTMQVGSVQVFGN